MATPRARSCVLGRSRGRESRRSCVLRHRLGAQVGGDPGPPDAWAALDDVCVMQEPIDQGRDGGGIAEQLAPLVHGAIGRQERSMRSRTAA